MMEHRWYADNNPFFFVWMGPTYGARILYTESPGHLSRHTPNMILPKNWCVMCCG